MSAGDITLTQDNGGVPIDIRSAAIDAVQPVFEVGFHKYTNVQVGRVVYQVRETREAIADLRQAAEVQP